VPALLLATHVEMRVTGMLGTAARARLTCYPFDAVQPGGPRCYLVAAEAASAAASRTSAD
jgi:hypothetical protein